MNCKEGDLVRYVGDNPFSRPNLYGWIGLVIEPAKDDLGRVGWFVDPPLPGGDVVASDGIYPANMVDDRALKPICDPGEDAQDETLGWKPVPLPEITPAMLDREVEHG